MTKTSGADARRTRAPRLLHGPNLAAHRAGPVSWMTDGPLGTELATSDDKVFPVKMMTEIGWIRLAVRAGM